MIEGVDYAWSRPDPAGLYAAGKRFASRYLSYDNTGKNLTAPEAQRLIAAGIAVVCNWEWQTGDAKGGYDVGRRYAQEAVRQAAACGMPDNRPIYFSVDYDPAGNYGPVDGYFAGIRSVLPVDRVGAYGGYDTIAHLLDNGLIKWAWQTYAWSGGRWHPGAHVQQYRNGVTIAGGDLDLDRAMVADFGQWGTGGEMPSDVWDYVQWSPNNPSGYSMGALQVGTNVAAYKAVSILENVVVPALEEVKRLLTGGVEVGAKVDLTDAAIEAVADAVADEIAADPERDGRDT